jgi:hypothetical protein
MEERCSIVLKGGNWYRVCSSQTNTVFPYFVKKKVL